MKRADERLLVADAGPPHCPACRAPLFFRSDRQGQTYAQCDCGYRAYITRRTGKKEEVAVNIAGL